jgi:GTP-binding protein EngB required for normal cell division
MTNIRNIGRADPVNIEEFIANIREKDRTDNPFQFHQCIDRNIILIGRTRTGKSTISEVINNVMSVAKTNELYSQTRTIQFKTISTEARDNIWYFFNFIDLPGFFDIASNGRQRLTNDNITTYLQDCMSKNITNIHMFAFVFNLAAGINERDIDTMLYVKTTYPYLGKYMALVITHCEQLEVEQRKRLIGDFFRHPKVIQSKLEEYFKVGTLFMGCLRHESVATSNEQSMYFEYNNILDMRTEFIEKCIQCDKPFNFYQGPNSNKCCIS